MQKYITIFVLLLLLSCGGKNNDKIPEDVLPASTMSSILTDMHLVEGYINIRPTNLDSVKSLGVGYRDEIYRNYQTTHEQFKRSFDFYNQHPVMLDSIYAEVITNLGRIEVEYRKQP